MILCYGEICLDIYLALDRLPRLNRAADVQDEFENVGGAAANSALWLAHWGQATRLAGHDMGDDAAGHAVLSALRAQPLLDSRFFTLHGDYRSPRCQCLVTPDGERNFIVHWLDGLRMASPSAALLEGVDWLSLDMTGPLPERLELARMAVARGSSVLVNDIYDPAQPLLPLVDVLVISASMVGSKVPGTAPVDMARALQVAGGCDVIVTDSAAAITVLPRGGAAVELQPAAVEVVDTTGAGDIFKAGLVYGLRRGMDLVEAARWGAAAGSLMCQYAGTTKTLAPLSALVPLLPRVVRGGMPG